MVNRSTFMSSSCHVGRPAHPVPDRPDRVTLYGRGIQASPQFVDQRVDAMLGTVVPLDPTVVLTVFLNVGLRAFPGASRRATLSANN